MMIVFTDISTFLSFLCYLVFTDSLGRQSLPPFGFPLSTEKLIQSAIGLISCKTFNDEITIPTREIHKEDRKQVFIEQPIDNIDYNDDDKQNTAVCIEECDIEVNGVVDMNSGPTSNRVDSKNSSKQGSSPIQMATACDGSVDISNLSALEDEGWQSQGKRSQRKKKKELAVGNPRERSQSNQKNKKEFPKHNNNRKQHIQNGEEHRNQKEITRETHKTNNLYSATKDNVVQKHCREKKSLEVQECKDKPDVESKPVVFSYRDALLKAKSRTSE